MRRKFALIVVSLATALPASAFAADARTSRGTGRVQIYPAPTERRIIVEKRADERLVVIDRDGTHLSRSYVESTPPRRVEYRAYVRPGQRAPHNLYGGFFGPGRWGVGRAGW